ncbi:DoxX family protein [uncultured Paracoccus sp.]|uniref:DoxX family protein n=1 Tax=uncultured Paracoccus sp. TaxID=189685 RepID=UPI002618FCFC|nr:DoxX family protein [uncultured Paracoccus sp.]
MAYPPGTNLYFPFLSKIYDTLEPYGYAFLRFATGIVMAGFGARKLLTPGGAQPDIDIMAQIGFTPAIFWAYLVITLELVGGLAIAAGLLTRVFSAMFVGMMLVILALVLLPRGAGYELSVVWLGAFTYLTLRGSGALSLDRLIGREI